MVGQIITDDKGNPLDSKGNKISASAYSEPKEVRDFRQKFQLDFQNAWNLMHHPFREFDGVSLLDRAKADQETFAAYVGVEYTPKHKRWRFKGRKNTARNKIIGILAQVISGMLFPAVYAKNENDEEDKMTAKVMGILIEEHLRKAHYETKFLYMTLSMLVNPASIAEVEFVTSIQKIKQQIRDKKGKVTVKVIEAVDEVLSGVQLNMVPIDEIFFGDYYSGTGSVHSQPHIFRERRVSYDYARSIYAGKYFDENGKDLFDQVQAGRTRWISTDANQTLFDIDYTVSDGNFVQILTGYYRSEDIEATFVGGIPMMNQKDVYNTNPFTHRRMSYINGDWVSVPIYKFGMSGAEPIDPSGRFLWYKSTAFKEYWDDQKLNLLERLTVDGVHLDVIKPLFLSGVAKADATVMAPGATVGMPMGARMDAYSLSPNLAAAMRVMMDGKQDISESTLSSIMQGQMGPATTATQVVASVNQARVNLGVIGMGLAKLIREVGELTMDLEVQHTTIGELDATVPENLRMKYKPILAKGKEKGKNVTNRIVFSDRMIGKKMSTSEIRRREYELLEKAGGTDSDQRIWEVNPYRFARTCYSMFIDADKIVQRSMGTDRQEKELAFEKLTDPRVLPFTDPEAVVRDFVLDEYSDGDPDRYAKKMGQEQMLESLMGLTGGSKPVNIASIPGMPSITKAGRLQK